MATRTWRGTTDTAWNTAGNWLENAVPTNADDVVFDDSASTYTLNMAYSHAYAKSFDTTGTANGVTLITQGGGYFYLYGSITLKSTDSITISRISTSATGTISQNGATINAIVVLLGSNSSQVFTLGSVLNIGSNALTVGMGTLQTSNGTVWDITCGIFGVGGSGGTVVLTLNSSILNISNVSVGSGTLTVTDTTHTINISSDSATANNFGGKAWGIVNFKSNASAARAHAITPGSGATFVQFNIDQLTDRRDCSVSFSGDFSVAQSSTWKSGGAGNDDPTVRLLIKSSAIGTARTMTVSAASQTITLTDVDVQDVVIAATNSPTITGTRVGDCGGNTNAGVSAPKTVYCASVTTHRNWYDNIWSATSEANDAARTAAVNLNNYPLPQDTAIVDDKTGNGGNNFLIMNPGLRIGNVDASLVTEAILPSPRSATYYGNLDLSGSGLTDARVLSASGPLVFDARVAGTLSIKRQAATNFSIGTEGITIDSYGGTVQLASALTHTGTFTLTRGTFDLNGNTLTTGFFSSSGAVARTLANTGGTGKIVLTKLTGDALDMSTDTSLTVTGAPGIAAGNSALTLTANANLKFGSTAKTFGALTFTKHLGDFDYILSGSGNTFGAVTHGVPDATNFTDVQLTAAMAMSVASWNTDGAAAHTTNIASTGAAVTVTDLDGGTNVFKNCTITSVNVSGATWQALTSDGNTVNTSTGWTVGGRVPVFMNFYKQLRRAA